MRRLRLAALLTVGIAGPAFALTGWDCTADCQGYEAGKRWALTNSVVDEDSCNAASDSFIEGCRAALRERGVGAGAVEDPLTDPDDPDAEAAAR